MGNIENTAINELIARASSGPRPTSPSGRMAAMAGIPELPDGARGALVHAALPVKMPVAAPFETTLPMSYPMVARALVAPAAPGADRAPGPAWTPPEGQGVAAAEPAWPSPGPDGMARLDPRRLHALMHQPDHERMVPTFRMRRRPSEVRTVVSRLVFPIALLVSTGIVIGAYVAFGGHGKAHGEIAAAGEPSPAPSTTETPASPGPAIALAAAPAAPAVVEPAASAPAVAEPVAAPAAAPVAEVVPAVPAPAPTAAPAAADPETAAPVQAAAPAAAAGGEVAALPPTTVAEPAPAPVPAAAAEILAAPAAAPSLVDVRIESIPSGATVTLVDRGRTQLVGDTPIDTALDPAREYDLVFTYPDKPPHVEHLDARATRRISAVLDARELPAPRHAERASRESAPERPSRARAEAAGDGTLMISSKPPCEIVIDGRSTGLTTPQRSIALPAGHHRITLLNSEKSIKRTLTVQIAANTTERVIEDLMK